jgi:2-keto-3-deoxy-L-rhamnonate aldolase RhmA
MKVFAWQQIPDTTITEILCNLEYSGVILDAEHSNFTSDTLYKCIQVAKLCNKEVCVRFTHLDKTLLRTCLDAGIDYAIFSTVESRRYCEEIIELCKYPSFGGKRGQGLVRENMWGKLPLAQKDVKVIVMIETKKGVDNLSQMKDLDIECFLIGMYDLSASLGCVGDFEQPIYKKYIELFKSHLPPCRSAIHLVRNYDITPEGFEFFAVGMDTTVLYDSYKEALEVFRGGK